MNEQVRGKKEWFIADGFMSNTQNGDFVSHEAVCVLNTSGQDANITIEVFFEDREPLCGFTAVCKNNRTNHIRLDKIKNNNNEPIPKEKPYALVIKSDVPVVCQHSRMDVSQAEMTLMTTMAW